MSSNLCPNDDRPKKFSFGSVEEITNCNTPGLIITKGRCVFVTLKERPMIKLFSMMCEDVSGINLG